MAKDAMDRVSASSGQPWVEVDVDSDVELQREYSDRVPVVLLDGKEHGYWRVEEDRLLRDLRDQIAARKLPAVQMDVLSMGMSHDFEVAIEEGSTCVRVGTAIFGARPKPA